MSRWANSPLIQRWQQLAERDRNALLLLGIALLLALGYLSLWQPLQQQLHSARNQFQEQRSLFEYLSANALRAKQGALNQQGNIAPAQLQSFALHSADQVGLRIERYEQNDEALSLSLNQAAYPLLLQWLSQLQSQGLHVQEINLGRDTSGALLDVQLTLKMRTE